MMTEIIYPIVIDLKIKKSRFISRLLVVEKDRISYFDKNETMNLIFESPIEDCQIFEKNSWKEKSYELHLISLSKYFFLFIILDPSQREY